MEGSRGTVHIDEEREMEWNEIEKQINKRT